MAYKELTLLGDSIGQGYWDQSGIGWFGRMTQRIGVEHPYKFGFHNGCQGGDTIIDVLHRFASEAQQRHGDCLLIAVGTNDLVRWHKPDGQTSLALDTSVIMWDILLSRAVKSFRQVATIACTPVIEASYPGWGLLNTAIYRRNEDIDTYNEKVTAVCAKYGVPRSPLFDVMKDRPELFRDGTHPNADGHQLMADHIFDFLKQIGWFA